MPGVFSFGFIAEPFGAYGSRFLPLPHDNSGIGNVYIIPAHEEYSEDYTNCCLLAYSYLAPLWAFAESRTGASPNSLSSILSCRRNLDPEEQRCGFMQAPAPTQELVPRRESVECWCGPGPERRRGANSLERRGRTCPDLDRFHVLLPSRMRVSFPLNKSLYKFVCTR